MLGSHLTEIVESEHASVTVESFRIVGKIRQGILASCVPLVITEIRISQEVAGHALARPQSATTLNPVNYSAMALNPAPVCKDITGIVVKSA